MNPLSPGCQQVPLRNTARLPLIKMAVVRRTIIVQNGLHLSPPKPVQLPPLGMENLRLRAFLLARSRASQSTSAFSVTSAERATRRTGGSAWSMQSWRERTDLCAGSGM